MLDNQTRGVLFYVPEWRARRTLTTFRERRTEVMDMMTAKLTTIQSFYVVDRLMAGPIGEAARGRTAPISRRLKR